MPKKKPRYKQIQAGQDWSDRETWYGLIAALALLGFTFYGYFSGEGIWR